MRSGVVFCIIARASWTASARLLRSLAMLHFLHSPFASTTLVIIESCILNMSLFETVFPCLQSLLTSCVPADGLQGTAAATVATTTTAAARAKSGAATATAIATTTAIATVRVPPLDASGPEVAPFPVSRDVSG